ncbi:cytochrome d ubiquinol oxidase subunit II [Sporolactobacillus laevolacticus]|uniref:Cytochrome D ubiquinol oxidase subunit II n=1 Tax=Sporolactobacillus laevolacticus DSM 442 TaxID=1395513 RepID=V6J044_9BACL|nr:cytochrome d ubiquinol oxidase subunit II [Sporolactobacillus laevolacticus]EST13238.1 hypothetical protein P343_03600 [Sporolactobacillus laevolacticus DSM 442]
MAQQLTLIILWIVIYSYMIAASIDFGTGFYLFYGQQIRHWDHLYAPLQSWLSPLSEVMNICFVLLFAAVLSLSPEIILNFQTPLVFCGILAIVLTVAKGTFYALAELLTNGKKTKSIFLAGNGVIGVFIPAVLSIVLVISEGGFSDDGTGNIHLFILHMFSNFYFWCVMVIAVVSIFYISAMYLVHFASVSVNPALTAHFRNVALFWSMPTVLASGMVFLGLEQQNPEHFMRTLDASWLFMLSLVCLLGAVTLVFLKRYKSFFILVMMQYFFALIGYTLSHFPYLIYPDIVMDQHLADWAQSGWFLIIVLVAAPPSLAAFLAIRLRTVLRSETLRKTDDK